jgi:hypothetical protein
VITPTERRYSENEFALILRKAFELQDREPGAGPADGLSLTEIQAVAHEVGLDPVVVEQAAALLRTGDTSTLARVFGGPTTYELLHASEGEVPREEYGKVVEAIRRATSHQGDVTELLGSLEWKTVGEPSQIHVTVSPREGHTAVRVFADRGPAGLLTYLLPGIAGLLAIGIGGAILEPNTVVGVGLLIGASLGSALVTGRTIWKATTARFRSRLGNLMGNLSQVVDESAQRPEPPDSQAR